jgi:predicted nucleic acid-binding protein
MKILLDTNVVLDAVASRRPFDEDAREIVLLAASERLEGFLTASSITDIYYVARKHLTDSEAREALHKLFQIFTVIDVRGADCEAALKLPVQDYEDAVVSVCARKAKVAYIVTRDADFLRTDSQPPVIHPTDFLRQFQK